MKIISKIQIAAFFFILAGFSLNAQTDKQEEIIRDAERAKEAFIAEDPGLRDFFEDAAGYAIFPNVGKGAYIIGGASGNGAVYQDGRLIGMADLKQLDIGLQFGGKAFREVIFFETEIDLERFKRGNFELSGNASAVAVEEGVAKTIGFQDGVAIATMPKAGAMVEVSVGGQKFKFEEL
ncbi:MAG TPA: lipid-binding SYLF domain-containing protein [Salinimicrobium sp.]|nr:lipid-binding SYLF domain-containing protein [Salinimicrobium sp.]